VTPEESANVRNKNDYKEYLTKKAYELYEAKENEFEVKEQFREVERVALLRTIDRKWMDHIDDMEELKRGIGLRSYGQRNPVVEYRVEGMDMFDDMVASIREDTVRMLFTIQVRRNAAPEREQVLKPTEHHNMTVRKNKKKKPNK
jgi:preprotein translocase subunit SecA